MNTPASPDRPIRFPALGAVHVVTGILLLPLATVVGVIGIPLFGLPALWFAALGVHLWRGGPGLPLALRRTHRFSLVMAILLCCYGVFALGAARRSAAAGGGLLGAYGILPVGLGVALAVLSIISLRVARSIPPYGARVPG